MSQPAPKIIGYEPKISKKFTCSNCGAIVEYLPAHERYTGSTDEGTKIKGLDCPGCGEFHRTNS